MYFFVMFCNIKSATDRETIPVSVTVNGVEFATSSFDFYYYYDCTIISISPSTGPISGGTTIVVTGTNFLASTLLSCRFGESTITSAIYLNSTSIQCLTPVSALGAKSFDVTVSNNGKDFSECNVSFKYINEVKVTSIYPVYGSISGGTNVTVLGYGFEVDTQYTCQFGMKQKVLATVVSKTEMNCVTLPSTDANLVEFKVLYERQSAVDFSFSYEFLLDPLAFTLDQTHVVSSFNGLIYVHGSRFENVPTARCCFNEVCSVSIWHSPLLVGCPVPRLRPNQYYVRVSNDGAKFTDKNPLLIVYHRIEVDSISPSFGSRGSQVLVYGTNFDYSLKMECSFGGIYVLAHFLNFDSMRCIVPPLPNAGEILFELIVDGVQTAHQFNFTYHSSNVLIADIYPRFGFKNQQTEVHLTMQENLVTSLSHCMFNNEVVPVSPYDDNHPSKVRCLLPLMNQTGDVIVTVSTDGSYFFPSDNRLTIVEEPKFFGFSPMLGPETGGTVISIEGYGFSKGLNVYCEFEGDEKYAVEALWLSSSVLECISPPMVPASYALVVATSDISLFRCRFLFAVYPRISIINILPNEVEVCDRNIISILGVNFMYSPFLACRVDLHITPASFVNRNEINCHLPLLTPGQHIIGVTNNGQDYVTSEKRIFVRSEQCHIYDLSRDVRKIAEIRLFDVYPAIVFYNISTTITLTGSDIEDTSELCCFLGSVPISAQYVSKDKMHCIIQDELFANSEYNITASNYCSHKSKSNSFKISVVPEYYIDSVQLEKSVSHPATAMNIIGRNFLETEEFSCLFSEFAVRARFVHKSLFQCIIPPLPNAGEILFELIVDGVQTAHQFNFTYHSSNVLIADIYPRFGFKNQQTEVHLTMQENLVTSLSHCMFNNEVVPVSPYDDNHPSKVRCLLPLMNQTGDVIVTVSTDGSYFFPSDNRLTIVEEPKFFGFSPMLGPETGGTVISIEGYGFSKGLNVYCEFEGDEKYAVEALWLSSSVLECISPPMKVGMKALLFVQMERTFETAFTSVFDVYPKVSIFTVAPKSGIITGGTRIFVHGTNFPASMDTFCVFDENAKSNASIINGTTLTCLTPRLLEPFNTHPIVKSLRLSFNGLDLSESSVPFAFTPSTEFTDVTPNNGPSIGGTLVIITGDHFYAENFTQPVCRIGTNQVEGHVVSEKILHCRTPPFDETKFKQRLQISLNHGVDWLYGSKIMFFTYYDTSKVFLISPEMGSSWGGTLVTVHGESFVENHKLSCKFGAIDAISIIWVSANRIVCESPPSLPGNVYLRVSSNGLDFSQDKILYEFLRWPVIDSIEPFHGSSYGDTLLTVNGANFVFSEDLSCRFGNVISKALFVNSSQVKCKTPPQRNFNDSRVPLSIIYDDYAESSETIFFVYEEPPVLLSIKPKTVYSSSINHIEVQIGDNICRENNIWCRFQDNSFVYKIVPSTSREDGRLLCESPMIDFQTAVNVAVSSNKNEWSSGHILTYIKSPKVLSISPSFGSTLGGTQVIVGGMGFLQKIRYSCLFGNTSVPALWMTNKFLRCFTSFDDTPNPVKFSLALNGYSKMATRFFFRFVSPIFLSALTPNFGSHRGGQIVMMEGTNFVNDTSLSCVFGNTSVPALFQSTSLILCDSPEHRSGMVSVSVVFGDTTSSSQQFLYLSDIIVSKIKPDISSVRGNTMLEVHGSGFTTFKIFMCEFGDKKVEAVYVNSELISCIVPPRSSTGVVAFKVISDYSVSLQDMTFRYIPEVFVDTISPSFTILGRKQQSIFLTGGNFLDSQGLKCIYGQDFVSVSAKWLSSTLIQCQLELPQDVLAMEISVSNNWGHERSSSVDLVIVQNPINTVDFSPNSGIATGGTLVSFKIEYRSIDNSPLCVFGERRVSAIRLSPDKFHCYTPPSKPGTSVLKVSFDSITYIDVGIFKFYEDPIIRSIFPAFGQLSGGTPIQIFGSNLNEVKYCVFVSEVWLEKIMVRTIRTIIFYLTKRFSYSSLTIRSGSRGNGIRRLSHLQITCE